MNNKFVYDLEGDAELSGSCLSIVSEEERLVCVPASERILLISHCLRNSNKCEASSGINGLECKACDPLCQVNILNKAAVQAGYGGVCIAPGGSMAVRFIKEKKPLGIVAVACYRELEEGIEAVKQISIHENMASPAIVVAPLKKEGCVDTEVDVDMAIKKISIGCSL